MAEIKICDHLTDAESQRLIGRLRAHRIDAHRSWMDASVRRIGGPVYAIFVDESQLDQAAVIVDQFKKLLAMERKRQALTCPNCKSVPPVVRLQQKMGWLRRLFTLGTKGIKCSKCGAEWFI